MKELYNPELASFRLNSRASLDSLHSEAYLDVALTEWVPSNGKSRSDESNLQLLAKSLLQDHDDPWLTSWLQYHHSLEAVGSLSTAIRANRAGDPEEGLNRARKAKSLFRSTGDVPGQLRAEFEEVYALHRSAHPGECLTKTRQLGRDARLYRFRWLEIQAILEEAACSGMAGRNGDALLEAERATETAGKSHYPVLKLRGLGFSTELHSTIGNFTEAWKFGLIGLGAFTADVFPPMRGYQFHAALTYAAERKSQWYLATTLNQEAVQYASSSQNHSIEAMARYRLATDALMAGEKNLSESEFIASGDIFAKLPPSEARATYEEYGRVLLAAVEKSLGNGATSEALLSNISPKSTYLTDYLVPLTYFETRGQLLLEEGRIDDAESALNKARTLSEQSHLSSYTARERSIWTFHSKVIYRSLVRIYALERGDSRKALRLWEHFRDLSTGPYSDQEKSWHLTDAQWEHEITSRIGARTYLTFVELEDGVALWVISNKGIVFSYSKVAPKNIQHSATLLNILCRDSSSDLGSIRKHSRRLFDDLFGKLGRYMIEDDPLILETDGTTDRIPFHVLTTPEGRYLGEIRSLIKSVSLQHTIESLTSPATQAFATTALVVAPTGARTSSRDLLPLQNAIEEATMVKTYFPNGLLLLAERATLPTVRKALKEHTLFHFAGHTRLWQGNVVLVLASGGHGDGSPADSYLDENILEKEKYSNLRLVVLAACSTNGDDAMDDTDRASLTTSFLRAGALSVVGSLWDVDSRTTEVMMRRFYTELSRGSSPATALHRAEMELIGRKDSSHPYYWAPFAIYGGS